MEWHERMTYYALIVAVILSVFVRKKMRDDHDALEARVEMLEKEVRP